MTDPAIVSAVANSEVANTVAKQLWPTMLFLVVMSIIAMLGIKWFSGDIDPVSIIVSYWLWFLAMLTITGFGTYVFILDARVQITSKQATNSN